MDDRLREDTRAIHGDGCEETPEHAGVFPLFMTSSFGFASVEEGARIARGNAEGYMYTRQSNPTIERWEERIALLEGAAGGCATASGMGAISSAVMHFLRAGENLLAPQMLYSGTVRFFRDVLPRYGIEYRAVDLRAPSAIWTAGDINTRVLYLESPDNPLLRMYDVESLIAAAHELDMRVIFDNTFNTPLLFRPLEWGADIVVHSATKYLSGHGHVLGGIILARDQALLSEIHHETVYNFGATLSPFNAWLLLLSLETLPVRMRRHCENAQAVAEFLAQHPQVAWVNYPGLASHPEHALARKYLPRGSGGMIAFGLKGGQEACVKALNAVRVIRHQVSLGDTKSLLVHPFSVMFETLPEAERSALGILPELLRLSVGLEDPHDLIADLERALG